MTHNLTGKEVHLFLSCEHALTLCVLAGFVSRMAGEIVTAHLPIVHLHVVFGFFFKTRIELSAACKAL